jgi:hypothetical protein
MTEQRAMSQSQLYFDRSAAKTTRQAEAVLPVPLALAFILVLSLSLWVLFWNLGELAFALARSWFLD